MPSTGRGRRSRPATTPATSTASARAELERLRAPSLRRVLNATGVIVHTNLGRAPLARLGARAGGRGRRGVLEPRARPRHGRPRVATGACRRCAAPPDRGRGRARRQQQRGGGPARRSPRSPRAARSSSRGASSSRSATASGSRTSSRAPARGWSRSARRTGHAPADYESAIGPETAALLRVHQSNYRIVGFTERRHHGASWRGSRSEPGCRSSTTSARGRSSMSATSRPPPASVAAGADLVCFSGDKLLGGPQAGIVVGRAGPRRTAASSPAAARAPRGQAHPGGARGDARAVLGPRAARREIPVLRMLDEPLEHGACACRAPRGARRRRGRGDGRPGRRWRASTRGAAERRMRRRGGARRAAPSGGAAGDRDRPRRSPAPGCAHPAPRGGRRGGAGGPAGAPGLVLIRLKRIWSPSALGDRARVDSTPAPRSRGPWR